VATAGGTPDDAAGSSGMTDAEVEQFVEYFGDRSTQIYLSNP